MRVKQQKAEKGAKVQAHRSSDELSQQNPPTFSLRYLRGDYCLSKCEKEQKAAFADTLHKLSQMTWQEIFQAHKHGLGCEKISRDAIKSGIPTEISEDVKFIAFRFYGKAPMVGYRVDSVFYVVWLDRDYTLYDHG